MDIMDMAKNVSITESKLGLNFLKMSRGGPPDLRAELSTVNIRIFCCWEGLLNPLSVRQLHMPWTKCEFSIGSDKILRHLC